MPLTLITGPANAGKARAVLDAARAEAARGREPLLVVPTRADVAHYRRELAGADAVFGIRVERFRSLVEEIGRRAGVAGRPLGTLARERVAAVAAARTSLRALGPTAATPGFAVALAELVAELEALRVEPRRLRGALRAWAGPEAGRSDYAEDVSALYESYRRLLDRLGRPDRELAAVRALDGLRRAPARWGGTPVLFYGFDDLTPLQLDAIETLARVVDAPVTVTLAYEAGRLAFAGRATTFQTLLPLAAEHRTVAARAEHYAPASRRPLHHLERSLFEPSALRVDPGAAVRLLEAGGERAEIELVAGEIRALLERGIPAEEVAVVLRSSAACAPLLGEVFGAYGIPHALEHQWPFSSTAVGHGLLALLRSALLDGGLEDLLAWLRTPGLLERPELADRLEAEARAAGTTSAADARELWERRHWPLQALDHMREAARSGPAELLARTADELERIFCAPWRRRAPQFAQDEIDEARALAVGRRAIAELHELALTAPQLAPDAASLVATLERLELVSGEAPGPGRVTVVDPLALRARRVRALFLCGLQQGLFPAPVRPEPFLADEERRSVAEASGLRLPRRDDGLGAERYLLYATLSRPEELLVLSWHSGDDEGAPAAPSLFLEDICDLFAPRVREERGRRALGAVRWPGPGAAAAWAAARERALTAPRSGPTPIAPLRDERILAQLRDQAVWSASGLEAWAACPVRWFVERLLRAEDLEPLPEPMVRGGLAHAVLETTLRGLQRDTGSARLIPERLPVARRLMRAALDARLEDFPLSARPERRPSARRRLEADLERYLEYAARAASPLEPRHLELSFGFEEEEDEGGGLPALDIGDGVLVRGRIDRVDVGAGGEAVVYDYKGLSAPEANKWLSGGNFQIAIYMRAAELLLGLRAVGGFYQPLGARNQRARGLLAADAAVELDCVNGDRRERGEFDQLVGDVVAAARLAAEQARTGELEPRPATCAYGGGCLYPTICRCES